MTNMVASSQCLKDLALYEDDKLRAYKDGGGVWTIGKGHTGLDPFTGKPITGGLRWTQEQSDRAFAMDLVIFETALNRRLLGRPTSQPQFDALLQLIFNIGEKAFATSTLLGLHRAGEYSSAQLQFKRWSFDNGKEVLGLERRRRKEALLYGPRDDKQLTKLGWAKR